MLQNQSFLFRILVHIDSFFLPKIQIFYFLVHVFLTTKVKSYQINEQCTKNISQYDFYDAYLSEVAIIYILHNYSQNTSENIDSEAAMLFIMELTMFQNAAVSRTNQKIVKELEFEGETSVKVIEQLYIELGKTIKFWNKNNFRYSLSQNLADDIYEAFEIDNALEDYNRNQNFLEHLVDMHGVQVQEKSSKALSILALVLTVIQVIPIIIEFVTWIITKNIYVVATEMFFTTSLLSFVTILLIRKNIIKRKLR